MADITYENIGNSKATPAGSDIVTGQVPAGVTFQSTFAPLYARANHTGTQALSTLDTQADNTLVGNVSGGAAAPIALTATQIRTLINVADGSDVTDATNVASSGAVMADGTGNDITGDIIFTEKADHSSAPVATKGYLWTKNTTPTTLIFTDDDGGDTTLGAGGGGGAFTADGDTQIAATTPIVLDQATGNEIGLNIAYTVNKATSGDDTGLVINQTDTASPGTSLLLDAQVGGASKFSVDNAGDITCFQALNFTDFYGDINATTLRLYINGGYRWVGNTSGHFYPFDDNTYDLGLDTSRVIRATYTYTLSSKNAASDIDVNAIPFTIKGPDAFTSASTNQDGGNVNIKLGEHASGGGLAGKFQVLDPADSSIFEIEEDSTISQKVGGFDRVTFPTSGNLGRIDLHDNSGNIDGAIECVNTGGLYLSKGISPKLGIVDTHVKVANDFDISWFTSTNIAGGGTYMTRLYGGDVDGDLLISDTAGTDFGLLQLGGITSSYPAIKRSTTILQARLADDSGFAKIQAAAPTVGDDVVTKTYGDANYLGREIGIAASDETTPLSTGTAKTTFRLPYAMTLTDVRASVTTAPTGANLIVDINESGTTVLSTKLSIDATEKTSETAATAAVISDSSLADDAEITIDIDQIGSTVAGAGLKIWLIGNKV